MKDDTYIIGVTSLLTGILAIVEGGILIYTGYPNETLSPTFQQTIANLNSTPILGYFASFLLNDPYHFIFMGVLFIILSILLLIHHLTVKNKLKKHHIKIILK